MIAAEDEDAHAEVLRLACLTVATGTEAALDAAAVHRATCACLCSKRALFRRRALFALEHAEELALDAFRGDPWERFATAFATVEFETQPHLLEQVGPLLEAVLQDLSAAAPPWAPALGWALFSLAATGSAWRDFQAKTLDWAADRAPAVSAFALGAASYLLPGAAPADGPAPPRALAAAGAAVLHEVLYPLAARPSVPQGALSAFFAALPPPLRRAAHAEAWRFEGSWGADAEARALAAAAGPGLLPGGPGGEAAADALVAKAVARLSTAHVGAGAVRRRRLLAALAGSLRATLGARLTAGRLARLAAAGLRLARPTAEHTAALREVLRGAVQDLALDPGDLLDEPPASLPDALAAGEADAAAASAACEAVVADYRARALVIAEAIRAREAAPPLEGHALFAVVARVGAEPYLPAARALHAQLSLSQLLWASTRRAGPPEPRLAAAAEALSAALGRSLAAAALKALRGAKGAPLLECRAALASLRALAALPRREDLSSASEGLIGAAEAPADALEAAKAAMALAAAGACCDARAAPAALAALERLLAADAASTSFKGVSQRLSALRWAAIAAAAAQLRAPPPERLRAAAEAAAAALDAVSGEALGAALHALCLLAGAAARAAASGAAGGREDLAAALRRSAGAAKDALEGDALAGGGALAACAEAAYTAEAVAGAAALGEGCAEALGELMVAVAGAAERRSRNCGSALRGVALCALRAWAGGAEGGPVGAEARARFPALVLPHLADGDGGGAAEEGRLWLRFLLLRAIEEAGGWLAALAARLLAGRALRAAGHGAPGSQRHQAQLRAWQGLAALAPFAAADPAALEAAGAAWRESAVVPGLHHSVRYHLEGFAARVLGSAGSGSAGDGGIVDCVLSVLEDVEQKAPAVCTAMMVAFWEVQRRGGASPLREPLARAALAWATCRAGVARCLAQALLLRLGAAGALGEAARAAARDVLAGESAGWEAALAAEGPGGADAAVAALLRFLGAQEPLRRFLAQRLTALSEEGLRAMAEDHSAERLLARGLFALRGGGDLRRAEHVIDAIEAELRASNREFQASRKGSDEAARREAREHISASRDGGGVTGGSGGAEGDEGAEDGFRIQRKIVPWDVLELEAADAAGQLLRNAAGRERLPLVVVASLIDRVPNLGGLARTCEIFGCEGLVLDSADVARRDDFKRLSVTAEQWLPITECRAEGLAAYLGDLRAKGYTIVAVEQTPDSVSLEELEVPQGPVALLLGREKTGVPAPLLSLADVAVQIPQRGLVRSLNVHVSGALVVWELAKQMQRRGSGGSG